MMIVYIYARKYKTLVAPQNAVGEGAGILFSGSIFILGFFFCHPRRCACVVIHLDI
jgi:hypothetical protein